MFTSFTKRLSALVGAACLAVTLTTPAQAQSDLTITPEIEVLGLGFFASAGSGAANQNYFPDYGTAAAYRVSLNLESDGDVGGRLRYFNYDETEPHLGLDRQAMFRMIDAEATFPLFEGNGRTVDGFLGLRRGDIHLDGSDFGENNPYDFSGTGLTLGGEYRANAFNDNTWFVVGGRYSLMIGDVNFEPVSTTGLDNVLLHAAEAFAGLEYNRSYQSFDLGLRVGLEMQYYGTDTYFPFAIDPETLGDTGLAGVTAGVSISF